MLLFHLTTAQIWTVAQQARLYRADSLRTQGFIHLSTAAQWPRTARRFYSGQSGLLLLTLDASRLRSPVRFEQADGEAFPHLFGPLGLEAVTRVQRLDVDSDGTARLGLW